MKLYQNLEALKKSFTPDEWENVMKWFNETSKKIKTGKLNKLLTPQEMHGMIKADLEKFEKEFPIYSQEVK